MKTPFLLLCLYIHTAGVAGACWAQASSASDDLFETHVRPLLTKRCYECHRRKAEAGLRLDSLDGMLKGGDSGPAIHVGDSTNSLLWRVVSGAHSKISMPPDDPLDVEEIRILERWIDGGAHWPKIAVQLRNNPDAHGISDEEREFWSFQSIVSPEVPKIDGDWGKHPIDAFVASHHGQVGLTPTSEASPHTLVRRLFYDLIGLPPSPRDVADFERASKLDSEAARTELVERLLASDEYGQRWAQHWLDLVRYADTAGDAADFPIPEAYKYRNYVIDAFKKDKPYNQFVQEQIAGDLMPCSDEEESWQRRIATGYIAIARRVGVSPQDTPHITIEDTLDNLGKTFLGLTIGCARCHDHKFDPIPTADYYALYGIFQSTVYPHVGAEHRPYRNDFVFRLGMKDADQLLKPYRDELQPLLKEERAAFERYREFQFKPVDKPGYNRDVAWQIVLGLRDEIRKIAENTPDLETAFAVSEGKSGDAVIQKQGDPKNPGPKVPRGFPHVLGGQTAPTDGQQSGRLQLARWIADENNPLTARVIVNRVWHHHFGRGIVATTSDFGIRGSRPSHPELLDYLAQYLINHGWSIKQLHRFIVSSKTYRLRSDDIAASAALDPENIELWRGNRRRLDAEQIRDSVLEFSGRLDRTPGKRHPFPHHLTYYFRQHEPFIGNYQSNQRTIFQFRQRIRKNDFLDVFDAPDGNLHVGTRYPTTTSLQSLYFMNSQFVEEQSKAIADRVIEVSQSTDHRIQWIYEQLYGRGPTLHEKQVINDQLARMKKQANVELQNEDSMAWTSMVRVMLCSNEFLFVD